MDNDGGVHYLIPSSDRRCDMFCIICEVTAASVVRFDILFKNLVKLY